LSWLLLGGHCRVCRCAIPVSYFLIELFSGFGAALAFAKYGSIAAICFMIQFGLLCTLLRSTSDQSAVRLGSVALLGLSTLALLLTQGGQHLMAYPIETSALGLIIGSWIHMQRRTGWLVCLVCVCAGFAAGPIGLALSALALGALCVWFPRSTRFQLYVDCALLLAVCFQPLWR
jgi:prepilin signal peptidase PulO-like enzyme (type II secretory pathway)